MFVILNCNNEEPFILPNGNRAEFDTLTETVRCIKLHLNIPYDWFVVEGGDEYHCNADYLVRNCEGKKSLSEIV